MSRKTGDLGWMVDRLHRELVIETTAYAIRLFLFFLQIVFLVLKLCYIINWPWYAVCAPILIYCGIAILLLVFLLVVYAYGYFTGQL